jgi:type IV secretory pathway VirB10-like protein
MSLSLLTAPVIPAVAQQAQPPVDKIVIRAGSDLRCRLEKGLRITKVGEPVTAKLVEAVYIDTTQAIPRGSMIEGHVSSVYKAPRSKRQLLSGDFTLPKIASVTFDRVILPDGKEIPIRTETTVGISGLKTAQYLPKSQRPGVRQKLRDAAQPFREPNKLQRLSQAAITSLPYHSQYLEQGTIFDATLTESVEVPISVQTVEVNVLTDNHYLHLRLLTALESEVIARGASIEASVSEPYYDSDHALLYPAGTTLEGTVSKATAAGWRKKNGGLLFSFRSARTPDGITSDIHATVAGVQAAGVQQLSVGKEGDLKATTSFLSRLSAALSLVGPSRAAADLTLNKTAWSRAGEGRNGFGLVGAGIAQASAGTAIGFGYFGGAMKMYDAFLAKGKNVQLPVNTPILLRVNQKDKS